MDALGPWHLLIIAGVFVVLFGAKRLPEAARSLGRSARILKTELHSLHDDHDADAAPVPAVTPATTTPTSESAHAPVSTP